MNVHFRTPTGDYMEMFDQMVESGIISTRGLKADAEKFGELVFDVNSAYFYIHGGYDYAKQFYADAYKAAVDIVGGEQYILSAVMHADERNRAMSEKLGEDVYHYHLHVVYIPVVEKEVRWTKRCKDPALVGTVKERIHQVSMSKKWASQPAIGEDGQPLLTKSGNLNSNIFPSGAHQSFQIGAHQKGQKLLKESWFYGILRHRGEPTFPAHRKGVH